MARCVARLSGAAVTVYMEAIIRLNMLQERHYALCILGLDRSSHGLALLRLIVRYEKLLA